MPIVISPIVAPDLRELANLLNELADEIDKLPGGHVPADLEDRRRLRGPAADILGTMDLIGDHVRNVVGAVRTADLPRHACDDEPRSL